MCNIHIDVCLGAHFGTTFPHLLFETYPDLLPKIKPYIYQPRIFGFRVHESSRSGPQMQWLRMRSQEFVEFDEESDEDELDKVINKEREMIDI